MGFRMGGSTTVWRSWLVRKLLPDYDSLLTRSLPSTRQDAHSGLLPRWHVNYNITMLRLISYGMDAHWAAKSRCSSAVEEAISSSTTTGGVMPTTHKMRMATHLLPAEYDVSGLLAYAIYPPLYVAGPIMTYNDFIWQVRTSSHPTQH